MSAAASSKAAANAEALKQCGKILQFLTTHKDAAPFLEPVNWKDWGLLDYPKVVKTPMDLGTVKTKLESGAYGSAKEFKHDVNLVWTNCMTYNQDGSEYYNIAANLKKVFEEKYAKAIKDDSEEVTDSRAPTLVDKKMFSQNIYNISSEDLGKVVQLLDQRCEACIKKIDPEDIEIDIDAIDAATFWLVDQFVRDCLPGGKKASGGNKKKPGMPGPGTAPPAAASSAAAGGAGQVGNPAKKQRLN